MNFKLNFGWFNIYLESTIFRTRNGDVAYGYTNRCEDGKYIVCIDYDKIDLQWIIPELKRLQQDFSLSHFYIFRSSKKSYHAVCFDKLCLNSLLTVLRSSSVDLNYINVPLKYGAKIWTLRITDKQNIPVEFVGRVASVYSTTEKSLPHMKFTRKIFDIKNMDIKNNDQSDKMLFSSYRLQ